MAEVKRSDENPILVPNSANFWEAEAVFNGCPVKAGRKIHLLYRAVSPEQQAGGAYLPLSTIGHATSDDGVHFRNRKQLVKPEYEWEKFGCEDPRVTKLDGKYYIFYTALSQYPFGESGIKIGLAITKNFKKIEAKHAVTPFNAKAMALFPEKIDGKFTAILAANTDRPPVTIGITFFEREEDIWSKEYWEGWYADLDTHKIKLERWTDDHIEVGAPPIKTKYGWLLFYSYIKNYFRPPATFGIEAVLLDLQNPQKIVARTARPLLVPQEEYEKYGKVPNVIFPSGALARGRKFFIYYGAADTTCAVASVNSKNLVREMFLNQIASIKLSRYRKNPILKPVPGSSWQSKAIFNAGVVYLEGRVHLLYRAVADNDVSTIGYASSSDGFTIDERLDYPIYKPRKDFEEKGTEDPRLIQIGDKIYMCYTAWRGQWPARVALTSISVKDFLAKNWSWTEPVLISPPDEDDKDAAIFPKKIKGKYAILHRLEKSIWIDFVDDLNFDGTRLIKGNVLMSPRTGERDSQKIGIAGPPIEIDQGWLLIYHGISKKADNHYHFRAAILDKNDPTKIITRTTDTIFEPETPYEREGLHVVFSCGSVLVGDNLFVYYGGADKVLAVATIKLHALLEKFTAEKYCP